MTGSAEDWIKRLDMSPASVGGWFAPALVSNEDIAGSALPPRFGVDHPLYSSNWYLLQAGEVLQLHALKQDELWFFHVGTPISLHVFSQDPDPSDPGYSVAGYSEAVFGPDPEAGETLQGVAPHSTWFGAELAGPGFALVSCSLSPGYERSDSEKPTREDIEALVSRFPEHAALILRLAAG
ncbi:cupin domain-containing protein [Arthrobacter sp. B2a2-09]|uniref:cupin domain-containing protein n=1 Tax=Arthrobacter sp. B2a2-09 TaxID=2952822 RepID=UPI0022CD5D68|nr:cupin domain-containing protein [Arthrobacter sp. B2a2-09]MCZ9882917.1 cupin domain-containing protein [Arthrobacter sp. B2a2-09]